jgi:hypothetical protein
MLDLYKMKLKGEPPFLVCEHCLDELHEIYTASEIEWIGGFVHSTAYKCDHCGRVDPKPRWPRND